jgi:hypothetical protein
MSLSSLPHLNLIHYPPPLSSPLSSSLSTGLLPTGRLLESPRGRISLAARQGFGPSWMTSMEAAAPPDPPLPQASRDLHPVWGATLVAKSLSPRPARLGSSGTGIHGGGAAARPPLRRRRWPSSRSKHCTTCGGVATAARQGRGP